MEFLTDDRGVEYVENATLSTLPSGWAQCGHCGRAWNDDKSTGVTPTPSGRCPFEYEHEDDAKARLEELRIELRAERMSYGELAELQSLADYIEPGDVELLEAAGVPEHDDDV